MSNVESGEKNFVLKIRLRRTGAKKQPRYRVVVAESSAPRDGSFVEIIGWYNPQADPAQVVVDTEKAARWLERGAQPSERVANLLKRVGLSHRAIEAASQVAEARARRRAAARSEGAAESGETQE